MTDYRVSICVPTSLNKTGAPDISSIADATGSIAAHLHSGMLIVVERATYPGTTTKILLPRLSGVAHAWPSARSSASASRPNGPTRGVRSGPWRTRRRSWATTGRIAERGEGPGDGAAVCRLCGDGDRSFGVRLGDGAGMGAAGGGYASCSRDEVAAPPASF